MLVVWSVICTLSSGWVEAGMNNGGVRSKVQEGFTLGLHEARGSYRPEWRKAILTWCRCIWDWLSCLPNWGMRGGGTISLGCQMKVQAYSDIGLYLCLQLDQN